MIDKHTSYFFAGIFRQIVEGRSNDPLIFGLDPMIFDYVGIAFSILSITRRCVNWWMSRGPMEGPSPPFTHSLKAATFYFLPHMLFRSTAHEEKTFIMFKVEFPFGTLSQYV